MSPFSNGLAEARAEAVAPREGGAAIGMAGFRLDH
jgi:hypothetical protein